MSTAIPVIIDTDGGIDDVVALALTARTPGAELAAVTTTYGAGTLATATRNASEILRLSGRSEVPVLPGCSRPLVRDPVTAPDRHGDTGVGFAPVPDLAPIDTVPNSRVLLDVISDLAGPVDLLTIGPLTNLAHATEVDLHLVRSRVRRHVGMFGTIRVPEGAEYLADFNAWCDPEAADRVLRAGLDTTMVPLDVGRQALLDATEVKSLAAHRDPLVWWLGQALRFYLNAQEREHGGGGCCLPDVAAASALLSPATLTYERVPLTVGLDEGHRRGHTTMDQSGVSTTVAVGLDVPRVRRMLGVVFGMCWSARVQTGGHG